MAVVGIKIAVADVANEADDRAADAGLVHLSHQLEYAIKVGAGGAAGLATQQLGEEVGGGIAAGIWHLDHAVDDVRHK